MESLEAILRKSTTLMIPGGNESNGDITSPKNIAQILTTYKHVMGGANQSQAMAQSLLSGSDANQLKDVVSELEALKYQ